MKTAKVADRARGPGQRARGASWPRPQSPRRRDWCVPASGSNVLGRSAQSPTSNCSARPHTPKRGDFSPGNWEQLAFRPVLGAWQCRRQAQGAEASWVAGDQSLWKSQKREKLCRLLSEFFCLLLALSRPLRLAGGMSI